MSFDKKSPVIPMKEAGDFFALWLEARGLWLVLPDQTAGSRERFRSYSSMTFLVYPVLGSLLLCMF